MQRTGVRRIESDAGFLGLQGAVDFGTHLPVCLSALFGNWFARIEKFLITGGC